MPAEHFTDSIRELNRDTDLEARKWFEEKRSVKLPFLFWNMAAEFFKTYFFKGTWRSGFIGFVRAVHQPLYQLMSYAKCWELTEQKRGRM